MNSLKSFKIIEKVFVPKVIPEGAGAKVRRIIGTPEVRRLDPFLMLDHFTVRLPAGFPDHPHRGFETVTYMLEGKFFHQDFKGNKGTLNPGDLQWMTAGKGILHAEMPASFEEDSIGFQLWINLSTKNKLCEPEYQEITKDKVPIVTKENVTVKVIAGESLGVKGPIHARTPAIYLDVEMAPKTTFEQVIPKGWNGFSYIYKGQAYYGENKQKVVQNGCAVLKKDDNEVLVIETQDEPAKFIIIAGEPMNEPIVSYGPFVLSSQDQLEKTFEDYHHGKNGFEDAPGWESEIQHLRKRKSI